jgi:hypothetical protein
MQVMGKLCSWAMGWVLVVVLGWGLWVAPAFAYDNPDLLPSQPTPIIDLNRSLTEVQEQALAQELEQFEREHGWKLRVVTQYDRTPGKAVKDFWGLDERSVLLVADPRGGNLLSFNVGDAVYAKMPRLFWIELQARFGNMFYVRDHGEDQAIIQALRAIETCLVREQGCRVVPGLPQEQWLLTLITSLVGGVICGFAAQPRRQGQVIAWQWVLIFSPLWGMLFISFGLGPVLSRTSDWLPVVRNVAGFAIGALVAYLSPLFGEPFPSKT